MRENLIPILPFLIALILSLVTPSSSRAQPSDGIVITEANYQGLQAFKHDLTDPRGVLRSWNGTGLSACSGSWTGIKCVRGQVIQINLPWRGLGGKITEKIGQLSALRKLSLHDNDIAGRIPSAIGFLPNLRGLYLFNNRMSGSIPVSIGNCLSLQTIDLSNNALVGSVPESLANLTKIYRINLSFNNLSGSIPAGISRSASLTFLSLQGNRLSGSIPDTWGGDNETFKLQILNLDKNAFSGSVPASFSKLPLLQEITLSNNQLNGSIPKEIGSLPRLQKLLLSNNLIASQIPESIDGLRNLSVFSIKNNKFTGEIPATIGNITNLSQLDLSDNGLSGVIPSSLAQLSKLTFLNVSNNNLSGPVPDALTKKFNASSFGGNIQLCGFSPSVPCPTPTPPPAPAPPQPQKPNRRKLSTRDIILIAAGIALAILLLLCCVLLCCLIRKRTTLSKKSKAAAAERGVKPGTATSAGPDIESGGDAGGKLVHFDGPFVFTADDLLCATAEIMGKSTYGTVYKATLEDGNQVAVKRLREKIAKGQREFETEVNILGKIRHQNLLALRAYYLGPKGEKLLVFDYMPKGSLAAFLHARGPDTPINWTTRMNIAMGAARGLNHLHTQMNMIHGNLTSSNILLDDNTDPKISDYGLSRLMSAAANANVMAASAALGYRAPELSKVKKANNKTDVYSLGVIMLELLTGKSPGETMNGADLPQWVASIVKEEWTNEVFDLELMRDTEGTTGDELLNTLKLALHCVDPSPAARPEIHQVLQQLEEIKPELAAAAGTSASGGGETSEAAGSTVAADAGPSRTDDV